MGTGGTSFLPALSLLASIASFYPPLSGLALAVPILDLLASLPENPSSSQQAMSKATQPAIGQGIFLCLNCNSRPRFMDRGQLHPFCSRSCALNAGAKLSSYPLPNNVVPTQTVQPLGDCVVCKIKPRYSDGKQTHPYCGRVCAKQGQQQMAWSAKNTFVTGTNKPCAIRGCTSPAFRDSIGKQGKYCSKIHKRLGETICIVCKHSPITKSHYCSKACATSAQANSPTILELPEDHAIFRDVAEQFKLSWRDGSTPPSVKYVFKILSPKSSIDAYELYRQKVESQGKFRTRGRATGNENRRWHGTKRECNIGEGGQIAFCASATCALCRILSSSFNMSHCVRGAFGMGIYTSSTSSKSDKYSANSGANKASKLKTLLLNKVVVGNGHKVSSGAPHLTAPPTGFNSVLVEIGAGEDELVVFENDAIRPSYLLLYEA